MNDNILKIHNLEIGYSSANKVIQSDINLIASKGELIALIGENGVGKSTLLRTVIRLQKPLNGNVFLYEDNIDSFSGTELAKKISYVSTEQVVTGNMRVFDLIWRRCISKYMTYLDISYHTAPSTGSPSLKTEKLFL